MTWKTAYRSFYYAHADPPDDIVLTPDTKALLVTDIRARLNTVYLINICFAVPWFC